MDELDAGFVGFCLVLCCGCGCGCDGGSGDDPLVMMCGTVEIVVDGNDLLLPLLLLSLMGIDTGGGVGELLVRSVISLGSGLRRSIGFAGCVAEDEDDDDDDDDDDDEEETDG